MKTIKQLAICDKDRDYLTRIQSYLNKKMLMDFEILTFDNITSAVEKSHDNNFEILLVGEKTYSDEVKLIKAKKVLLLCEDEHENTTEYETVAKYQSMEKLVAHVLEKYAIDEKCDINIKCGKNKTSLITFYSPEHHGAQTLCALAASQVLAEKTNKVLYLNLHGFSGFEEIMNISFDADITDFMYFVLKHSEKLLYKLEGIKRNIRGVDYLPPAFDFNDLVRIESKEWKNALDLIMYSGDYTHIVIDISESCQGYYDILDRSDKVYVLYNDTSNYGRATLEHFKRLLREKQWNNIINNMTTFSVPYDAITRSPQLGALSTSEIGAYMRGVV